MIDPATHLRRGVCCLISRGHHQVWEYGISLYRLALEHLSDGR